LPLTCPPGPPVFSTNKTDRQDITEILSNIYIKPNHLKQITRIEIKLTNFLQCFQSNYIISIWAYLMKVIPETHRAWWRLFQKRIVHTKFDIYVYITITIQSLLVFLYNCLIMIFFWKCENIETMSLKIGICRMNEKIWMNEYWTGYFL
jgi:hypothetical protein